jgi:site-specific recombinase XerD
MRRNLRMIRLKGIKIVNKPNGRQYKYRRVGHSLVQLPDLPIDHPEFIEAYIKAGKMITKPKSARNIKDGSIASLILSYRSSITWKSLRGSTKQSRIRILDKIGMKAGGGMVADLQARHIKSDLKGMTPHASKNRLKVWRAILNHAIDEDWIADNPAAHINIKLPDSDGHHPWTDAEIEMYRSFHKIGSPARLAFEVYFWTGARCGDARRLGVQMIDPTGWITFTQEKTRGKVTIPFNCQLPEWMHPFREDYFLLQESLKRANSDAMLFILTRHGKPRSEKGISQWMSEMADKAGLPKECTAHGLRKARAIKLAEAGASVHEIAAWTGHITLKEIENYTREASKRRILEKAETRTNFGNTFP